MNILLLHPTDVLFFRDGRPMEGSMAGHGAAWPLPHVMDGALHAALHRSGLGERAHAHRRSKDGAYREDRDRLFGSLQSAGPFPVRCGRPPQTNVWFFPRPADLLRGDLRPCLPPSREGANWTGAGSLPPPLRYAVANLIPPSKDHPASKWLSSPAYRRYLNGGDSGLKDEETANDDDFCDTEFTVGIGIDPETQTTGQGEASGRIYSAHYLRLREEWRLGVMAAARDKALRDHGGDLIRAVFNGAASHRIMVGGQQRVCTAFLQTEPPALPLPAGRADDFPRETVSSREWWLVKWVLLSPAIWPEISGAARDGRPMKPHPGGWLPNWIDAGSGAVLLKWRSGNLRRDYAGSRAKRVSDSEGPIDAYLVAALIPKPIVVTGWALSNPSADRVSGGAKSTQLAVPAGAVYYFAARSPEDARHLADALNWHGAKPSAKRVQNRRSTLLGEKGFGIGVCGGWRFFESQSKDAS